MSVVKKAPQAKAKAVKTVGRATQQSKTETEVRPELPILAQPVKRYIKVESGEVFMIQKDIPISGTYRSLGPHMRYPFSEMSAGESFEIKTNANDVKKTVSRLSAAAVSYAKSRNNASKFAVRRTSKDTVRVWRIL